MEWSGLEPGGERTPGKVDGTSVASVQALPCVRLVRGNADRAFRPDRRSRTSAAPANPARPFGAAYVWRSNSR